MGRPKAMVDPSRCRPETCNSGVCAALASCPHKILRQEAAYETPFVVDSTSLCRGCFKCLAACPLKAIRKMES